jgi:hypothetical protein
MRTHEKRERFFSFFSPPLRGEKREKFDAATGRGKRGALGACPATWVRDDS